LAAQLGYWDGVLETLRLRAALRLLLNTTLLGLVYKPDLLQAVPRGFGDELRRRLRRGFARHPNRANPYARGLLLGETPADTTLQIERAGAPVGASIEVACADAAEYLEHGPARRFRAFSLSNILDGADARYAARLVAAVRRAAEADAIVVSRSFASARDAAEDEAAGRDRALLWGRVSVTPAASFVPA
jgi:S-adenosylmethionine:diacylglycerol 3-amino-3-carboxypropyl transferase